MPLYTVSLVCLVNRKPIKINQNHVDQQFRLLLETMEALLVPHQTLLSVFCSISSIHPLSLAAFAAHAAALNRYEFAQNWLAAKATLVYDWSPQGGLKFNCRKRSSWASQNKQECPIDLRKYLVQELPRSFAVERSNYGIFSIWWRRTFSANQP